MITVTASDGNPVRVVLLIPGLSVATKFFGGSKVKGKFAQSGKNDETQFIATHKHNESDLVIWLTEWTLEVQCKIQDRSEDLRYLCQQFPGPIVPGEAQYEITKGKVLLNLPKVDSSQSWVGQLTVKGLDQSS